MAEEYVYGWKFLNPYGVTEYGGEETIYPLPGPNEKWGLALSHPNPITDGKDCGPGRYHMMRSLDARHAPSNWWPWFARGRGIAGKSGEKVGVHTIEIRRVPRRVFWRIIRLGWCKGANLEGADLRKANLEGADLGGANLRGADLREAKTDKNTMWPTGYIRGEDESH